MKSISQEKLTFNLMNETLFFYTYAITNGHVRITTEGTLVRIIVHACCSTMCV